MLVGKSVRALRDECFRPGSGRHGPAPRFEVMANLFFNRRIVVNLTFQQFCDSFTGQVIRCWSKPSRDDNQIRAAEGFANGGLNGRRGIEDRNLPCDLVSFVG